MLFVTSPGYLVLMSPSMESPCSLNDAHLQMDQTSNALLHALMSKDISKIRALVDYGARVSPADSWIIYEACLEGPDVIDALSFNNDIDLNPVIPGQDGDRVFHHLLRTQSSKFKCGKFYTIKLLLQKGVNPMMRDRKGNTALHILSQDSLDSELLRFLLCDTFVMPARTRSSILESIDYQNKQGRNTALIVATQRRLEFSVRLLLEKGSNPHIQGEFGRTALYFAVARDCVEIARLLLRQGAVKGLDIVPLSRDMENLISGEMYS